LCTIKMHNIFINTSMAMETSQDDLSLWTQLYLGSYHAFL
jgi:hypothetical protein